MIFFFFNDTATTEIYTLSLHDALPISDLVGVREGHPEVHVLGGGREAADRKSTRLNSSHSQISYAVFCLKKIDADVHDKRLDVADLHGAWYLEGRERPACRR